MLKYSRQRECIKEYLMASKEHPTADMVYRAVRQEYPNISLGTVYRNLGLLAEHGVINRVSLGDGIERYDAHTEPHYHFVCRTCGKIVDLEIPTMDHINVLASNGFKGRIDGHVACFYGACEDCV